MKPPEQNIVMFGDPKPTPVEGRAQADSAIAAVTKNAGEDWKEYALGVVQRVALELPQFTTQDVTVLLAYKPHDLRAMGGVMREAQRRKLIEWTGGFKAHTARHMTPARLWRKSQ
jgi:hypothetical protein